MIVQPCSNILSESCYEKGTLVRYIQINFALSCQFIVGNVSDIPPVLRLVCLVLNLLGNISLLLMYFYTVVIKNTKI